MLADCFVFVMAAHENMHLGQLSAWRRVQGMADFFHGQLESVARRFVV